MSSVWSTGIVRAACWLTVGVGVLVLVGYLLGLRPLVTVVPGMAPVSAETGVGFLAVGTAFWAVSPRVPARGRRQLGRCLGLLAAALGATVLMEYVTDRRTGIDLLLFADRSREWYSNEVPGRMSPHSAVAFVVIGLAIALLDVDAGRAYPYARTLVPLAVLVTGVALVGRAYGADYLYGTSHVSGQSASTALTFMVLAAGLWAARPERPPFAVLNSAGLGGVTVRRLIPAVAAAVLLAGVLFSAEGGAPAPLAGWGAISAGAILLLTLGLVIIRNGNALDAVDRDHSAVLSELRTALGELRDERDFVNAVLQSLPDGVVVLAPDGSVRQVSERWSEITGYPAADAIGRRPPYPWWPDDHAAEVADAMQRAMTSPQSVEVEAPLQRVDGAELDVVSTTCPVLDEYGAVKVLVTSYRDVTARRRAEDDQIHTARQLSTFFDMSGDLMCIAGEDGYFKRLNPVWEQILGYTIEELTSQPYQNFLHPDDVERTAAEAAEQTASGKSTVSFENRYRCRDGSYRSLQWNATPQGDEVYAVARDTTSQRIAEEARSRLAAIVESTEDAIISKTLDGTITSWNPGAERMYGYRAEEVLGRSIQVIFDDDDRRDDDAERPDPASVVTEILGKVARGESVTDHDSIRRRKDDTKVNIALTVSPIRDARGAVIGAASIARDVTSRRKAEERFRRLLQAAPDAMVIVDHRGLIVLANDQTEHLFGHPAADLIGQPVEILVPERLRHGHPHRRQEYVRDPTTRRVGVGMELSGLRRDGSEFPIEISLGPLDTEHGTQISAAIRDISDRKRIEHDLSVARDEAVAAAQVKTQFVATVSHEIRTPMNGVIGLTALLLKTPLQPGQRRYAEAIRASGKALLAIINDILDFSKAESGKITIVERDFDLGVLIEEAIHVAAEAARVKDLEIVGYYPPRLPSIVSGDDGRLRQILLNLLGNAVKFTEHGTVLLRADPADPPHAITFTVADTGIGIAPDDLARIFEPFSQIDAATNRQFGGTGLGLAICRELVALMGGRLTVESQPGQGSRFAFTISLTPRPQSADNLRRAKSLPAGLRLLIVEGNETRRSLLDEHTTAWGMAATTTTTGHDAMESLRSAVRHAQPYELVVIDQDLSDIDGTDLAAHITDDPTIDNPHLVLLTTGAYEDDELATAHAGAVLAKPIGPSQLYDCFVQLLNPQIGDTIGHGVPAADDSRTTTDHGLLLLAEDNAVNQLVALDTLAVLGYRADVASNGLEAVDLAATNTYGAILMDCQMPKMDGFAATAEIRRQEGSTRHTPIIAMTAGALAEDRDRCLAVGMDDYLSKPIDVDVLRAALERWHANDHPDETRVPPTAATTCDR